MKLDLTKSRLNLLKKVSDQAKEIPAVSFCCADMNCRLQVRFHDAKQKDFFLVDIVDSEM